MSDAEPPPSPPPSPPPAPSAAPLGRDPLDHDSDGRKGGAAVKTWIVDPRAGLQRVAAAEVDRRLKAGARLARARDFKIAGVDPA